MWDLNPHILGYQFLRLARLPFRQSRKYGLLHKNFSSVSITQKSLRGSGWTTFLLSRDSNPDHEGMNLVCYHYTTQLYRGFEVSQPHIFSSYLYCLSERLLVWSPVALSQPTAYFLPAFYNIGGNLLFRRLFVTKHFARLRALEAPEGFEPTTTWLMVPTIRFELISWSLVNPNVFQLK